MHLTTYSVPELLFVEITKECHLRCGFCHAWKQNDPLDKLSESRYRTLIDEFSDMNLSGTVIFTGGEPFLKFEKLFKLTFFCKKNGLTTLVNTNGLFLLVKDLENVLLYGPQILVVSLDSHIPSIHDHLRGVVGTYNIVVENLKKLLEIRNASSFANRIYLSSIILKKNIHNMTDYINFARSLGVDGITFQILQPTLFSDNSNDDQFHDDNWFCDLPKAEETLKYCQKIFSDDPFVLHSQDDFEYMMKYLYHPHEVGSQICDAARRNVMVDSYGETMFCHDMHYITGHTLGNIKDCSLHGILSSATAWNARELMLLCRKSCGMMNCYRRR